MSPSRPVRADYDEFGLLADNAAEAGLPYDAAHPPAVERREVDVPSGGTVSALVWGEGPPDLVLIHGVAQNAHTWDTVALANERCLVALDLPGHGHSSWRPAGDYRPTALAADVAAAVAALAPTATTLVGMSLGGLTALAVLDLEPSLVERVALIDITPGVDRRKTAAIAAFVGGPESFADYDKIVERTVAFNPTRSRASLERGVRHNACPEPDGTWTWRYDRSHRAPVDAEVLGRLWAAVGTVTQPLLLVQGATSPVVSDADVDELRRRRPAPDRATEVLVIDGAGHSIQGDHPIALAAALERFHTTGRATPAG